MNTLRMSPVCIQGTNMYLLCILTRWTHSNHIPSLFSMFRQNSYHIHLKCNWQLYGWIRG